jgi:protein TonB
MFESLALENPRNTRRRWTTAASFVLEGLAVGVLILAPLGYTEAISLKIDKQIEVPPGRATAIETHARPTPPTESTRPQTQFNKGRLIFNGKIPTQTPPITDPLERIGEDRDAPYVPGGMGVPNGDPTLNQLLATTRKPPIEVGSTVSHQRVPISHLDPGMLIRQFQPVYPKLAIISHTEGTVLLTAVIDTQGRVTQLRTLSGHPLLIAAAVNAVQEWRYKPYILNGQPVEVETQVSVVFTLQH